MPGKQACQTPTHGLRQGVTRLGGSWAPRSAALGPHRKTSGTATEPKCKFMLAKVPESARKNWSWSLQYSSSYRVNSELKVLYVHCTYGCMYACM